MPPDKIDTTYGELRDNDVLIAKDGARWHVSGVEHGNDPTESSVFWLGDVRTKVRAHRMTKPAGDPVTVERIATHADQVAKLEAGSALPDPTRGASDPTSSPEVPEAGTPRPLPGEASPEENARRKALLDATFGHDAGVTAVLEGMPGSSVDVDVTAAEVDAAAAATDDDPVVVELFENMTDLEQRSHLYVLHGVFSEDVPDRRERSELHVAAHRDRAAGKLKGLVRPHVHSGEVTK